MAGAERVYVDPSALCCLYVHEERSRSFSSWRRKLGGALVLTRHGYAELVNAFGLAVFRGYLGAADSTGAAEDLDADIAEGRLRVVDLLWRRTMDRAVALSRAYTPATGARALDVLHVAAALILEKPTFVTYDARQARLVRAAGLKLLQP